MTISDRLLLIVAIFINIAATVVILMANSNNARSGREHRRRFRLQEAFDDDGLQETKEEEGDADIEIDQNVVEKLE
jgi:hypothetical protein